MQNLNVGDPTPPGSNHTTWSPVNLDNHQYLRIDTTSRMELDPEYIERVNFWKRIMKERPTIK